MTTIETMFKRAAERFVNKVEAGEAHSVETYAELKRCLEALAERERTYHLYDPTYIDKERLP